MGFLLLVFMICLLGRQANIVPLQTNPTTGRDEPEENGRSTSAMEKIRREISVEDHSERQKEIRWESGRDIVQATWGMRKEDVEG